MGKPWRGADGPRFVNQGPDKRFKGRLGHALAWLQWHLSFHSGTSPRQAIWRPGRWKLGVELSRPWFLPFLLVFVPRKTKDKPRWWSFRAGWRWDAHPNGVGGWDRPGYIADVIVKGRIDNLVEVLVLALVASLAAAGCAGRRVPPPTVVKIVETVEVKVPVIQARTPPSELLASLRPPLPSFVSPEDPLASSALTVEGERLLRGMIEELLGRIEAWQAWALEE